MWTEFLKTWFKLIKWIGLVIGSGLLLIGLGVSAFELHKSIGFIYIFLLMTGFLAFFVTIDPPSDDWE
jgi:hypothetical protein